ncbi:Tuftelin-interacting protein 11 [Fasciola hepatica]|uniref:Tuftelin-interacting protein 11 n=1 Tax=Fasciola hepatica TaxID=6192 RepID=A0A4E0RSZ9_FASHE|nr:Tuftelin-interacting protein 11 [Fasciola hepatica]
MGSSPEMERFGVSDADYEYMMDPLARRHKQSRKQRIYGVFASDDSGSDEERSGFGGRDKRKGANYSAPITFVSGGVKVDGKDADRKTGSAEADDVPISDEEDDRQLARDSDSNSSADESNRRFYQSKKQPRMVVGAGRRAAVAAASAKSNVTGFGAWERHTKGIGMKLLEQMGYQPGRGLGSEGQGITTPVQATQRVGKVAVGYFGSESAPAPRRGGEAPKEDVPERESGPRYKKKTAKSSRPLFDVKTADEIVASLSPANPAAAVRRHGLFLENSEMSKVKVIDMTSKEQRVYSGYEAALSRTTRHSRAPDEPGNEAGPDAESQRLEKRREGQLFDCVALRHNLGLIVQSCEDEIRKADRTARFEEDRAVALEHEIEKLQEVVKNESSETKRLKDALDLIENFEAEVANAEGELVPDEIAAWVTRIRQDCADLPEMPVLMAAIVRPMLDKSIAKWKPLVNPSFCFPLLSKWHGFFQNTSAFDVVLQTSWLDSLRRTIVNDWDPRDCEPLLEVLEVWKPLLPDELLECRILDQLILPKLHEAVSSWNPLTDTIPIHTWLHPWLPWFGGAERLSAVHEIVLQKLGLCLNNWHPSDGSAHSVLLPWRSVVSVAAMSAFLNRHVLPKLSLALQQFKLNPASQNMDAWNWVMRWADLLGPAVVVNLLEQHFWSRWLTVLSNWLVQAVEARQRGDQSGAAQVYQEVGRWYAGWKGQLPPECMEFASVKSALTKALSMMERSMRGLPPEESKPVAPAISAGPTNSSRYPPPSSRPISESSFVGSPLVAPPPVTLRKQVEQVAAQRGFIFHPVPNRMFEGQQVYRLEGLHVFFDRNVSFVHNPVDGGWHPISFSELMTKAQY